MINQEKKQPFASIPEEFTLNFYSRTKLVKVKYLHPFRKEIEARTQRVQYLNHCGEKYVGLPSTVHNNGGMEGDRRTRIIPEIDTSEVLKNSVQEPALKKLDTSNFQISLKRVGIKEKSIGLRSSIL